jgi:hypothetical protein
MTVTVSELMLFAISLLAMFSPMATLGLPQPFWAINRSPFSAAWLSWSHAITWL